MLGCHDVPKNDARCTQGTFSYIVHRWREGYTASPDSFPRAGGPLSPDDSYGGVESRGMAKARQGIMAGTAVMACL